MTGVDRGIWADVVAVLCDQDGVIARRQALECGLDANDVRRLLRNEWRVVYPGVYVEHSGPLTRKQREWAAVLDAWPAALGHASALPDHDGPIHLIVAANRRVRRRPGVVLHYRSDFDDVVMWNLSPPRQRVEEAVLDVAVAAPTRMRAVALLADAVNSRIVSAQRLIDAIGRRRRIRWRQFLLDVLADIRDGTCSVLEYGYATDVERTHGLPTPIRQAPIRVGRPGRRDLDYDEFNLAIELDGWQFHDNAQDRDRDMERDLDAAVAESKLTLRLGFGQVFGRPCVTASKVGRALRDRGWTGTFVRCPRCPPTRPTVGDTPSAP